MVAYNNNKLLIKSGFVTPQNIQFNVPYEKMGEFCEKYCKDYAKQSTENKQRFNEFSNNYNLLFPNNNLFLPYYDFLIHELKFLNIGFLNEDKIALSFEKKLKIFDTENISNIEYKDIMGKYIENTENNLPIYNFLKEPDVVSLINGGFLFRDGSFLATRHDEFHEGFASVLINLFALIFPLICKDYINDGYKYDLKNDYLTCKLGICTLGNYRRGLNSRYNPFLTNDIQTNTLEKIKKFTTDFLDCPTLGMQSTCVSKELIKTYSAH